MYPLPRRERGKTILIILGRAGCPYSDLRFPIECYHHSLSFLFWPHIRNVDSLLARNADGHSIAHILARCSLLHSVPTGTDDRSTCLGYCCGKPLHLLWAETNMES